MTRTETRKLLQKAAKRMLLIAEDMNSGQLAAREADHIMHLVWRLWPEEVEKRAAQQMAEVMRFRSDLCPNCGKVPRENHKRCTACENPEESYTKKNVRRK